MAATCSDASCECKIFLEELMGAADMRLNGNCINCGHAVNLHPRNPAGTHPQVAAQKEIKNNVCHMQSQSIKRVSFPATYKDFRNICVREFESELRKHGNDFKVYRMPTLLAVDIEDRELINAENYKDVRSEIMACDTSAAIPAVYLWSVRPGSKVSPSQRKFEDFRGEMSASSRSGTLSFRIRANNKFKCMACNGDYSLNMSALEAAHILELEELDDLSKEEIDILSDMCGIYNSEQINNFIPLCTTCHTHFDFQRLGIDGNYCWLVKPELEDKRMPHSGVYGDLRGSELTFARRTLRPPPELINHRLERFLAGITSRGKKRKAPLELMDEATFKAQLQNIGCTDTDIANFWRESAEARHWKITGITKIARRPSTKDSDWIEIQPPPGAAGNWWFNEKTGKIWIKLRGG